MSDLIGDPEQLAHEQARVACEGFLWGSKVGMRHSMFMIEECIQNDDLNLTNTKNTTNLLRAGY